MTGNELRWVSDWNGAAGFHLHGQTDTQVMAFRLAQSCHFQIRATLSLSPNYGV